jgi:predicted HicB family RNase H-like nuclease
MKKIKSLQYNGFYGCINHSKDDRCFYGKILHINNLVTFEASSLKKLEHSFKKRLKIISI